MRGKSLYKVSFLWFWLMAALLASCGPTKTPTPAGPPTNTPMPFGMIVAADVPARSGPGNEYDVVGTLDQGDVVRIWGIEEGWYKVQSEQFDRHVWVYMRFAQEMAALPTSPPPPTDTPSPPPADTPTASPTLPQPSSPTLTLTPTPSPLATATPTLPAPPSPTPPSLATATPTLPPPPSPTPTPLATATPTLPPLPTPTLPPPPTPTPTLPPPPTPTRPVPTKPVCSVQGIKRILTSSNKVRFQVQYYIPPSFPQACFIGAYVPNKANWGTCFPYVPAGRLPDGVPKGQHHFADDIVVEVEYVCSQSYTSSTIEVVIYDQDRTLCSSIMKWGQTWQ
jgi:hypothetical protein